MARLGSWGSRPRLAVAVSGGADSMALALLASGWGQARGFIVDHGLRPESAAEAALVARRLAGRGIPARILTLGHLPPGPGLPSRARRARYAALIAACRAEGLVHLLLGHHAGDQAETVLMRQRRRSAASGLAGMAALAETDDVRLIRPFLTIPPGRLRATLVAAGIKWVEDPTNRDERFLRPRLRAELRGAPRLAQDLLAEAERHGRARADRERAVAAVLAERAVIRPEGFAILTPGPLPAEALAALIQALAGLDYPPRNLAALAAAPRPGTVSGIRILPAGRLGPGLLLVREAAALAPPVAARPGAVWDGRFRLTRKAQPPPGASIGALGPDAARLRKVSCLPAAVLQALPAIRADGNLFAVPHIGYPDIMTSARVPIVFAPPRPAAGAPFVAA